MRSTARGDWPRAICAELNSPEPILTCSTALGDHQLMRPESPSIRSITPGDYQIMRREPLTRFTAPGDYQIDGRDCTRGITSAYACRT